MLELEHIFELQFVESEICLPLFEYETHTEHKKPTPIYLVSFLIDENLIDECLLDECA